MTSNTFASGPTTLPELLSSLRGTVVEPRPRPRGSLRRDEDGVRRIGVKPNAGNRDRLRQEAARLDRPVPVPAGRAEQA